MAISFTYTIQVFNIIYVFRLLFFFCSVFVLFFSYSPIGFISHVCHIMCIFISLISTEQTKRIVKLKYCLLLAIATRMCVVELTNSKGLIFVIYFLWFFSPALFFASSFILHAACYFVFGCLFCVHFCGKQYVFLSISLFLFTSIHFFCICRAMRSQ